MNRFINKFKQTIKQTFTYGFKYGKIAGIAWFGSMLIIAPIVFIYGGWPALVAYLMCKFSGVCPL